jgi:RND family efflux transporter MFP subunit
MRKRTIIAIGAVAVLLVGWWIKTQVAPAKSYPAIPAGSGDFVIKLTENGELKAKRAVTISAPRVRGKLLITRMAPEGSTVKKGDFLLQFDTTEQDQDLSDSKSNLQLAEAELRSAEADYKLQIEQLELELNRAGREAKEKQYEAPLIREDAERALKVAAQKKESQIAMLEAALDKKRVEVERAREKLAAAKHDLNQMTITASIPGLVVYLDIWKGGQEAKVQEGDSPWPGQGLINLPDLSEMQVQTTVGEVDVQKVKTGQEATIKLDAFPDREYHGTVASISTLARKKNYESELNVFDVDITVTESDEWLKPGMSAKLDIIVDRVPNAIWVPIEAVFDREGKTVVYVGARNPRPVEVEVGERSDTDVIIKSGLQGGETICLNDPTQPEGTVTAGGGETPPSEGS